MKRRVAAFVFVGLLMLAPTITLAVGLQTVVPADCNGQGGCQSICDLATIGQNLLDDGIFVAIFLSAILFAWAGWQMVVASSSGNETELHHAKNIFKYVTIGLVVIISSWLIVSVIMSALTNNTQWNVLCSTAPVGAAQTGVGAQPY